jgi:hypothetical protein
MIGRSDRQRRPPARCLAATLALAMVALLASHARAPFAQAPVCSSDRYGSAAQAAAIERAHQTGSVADSVAAIRAAQAGRGLAVGCAELDYRGSFGGDGFQAPTLDAVRAAWSLHVDSAPAAQQHYDACPALGRSAGAWALGGWSARSVGLSFPESPLVAIADNLVATQYSAARTPGELATWTGLFAYARRLGDAADPCHVPGVVGDGIVLACTQVPGACVDYRSGRFAGEAFVVGDYWPGVGLRDGGAGFDQGWAGQMMLQAALGASDGGDAARFRDAALAAADWAIAEPAVRNHNYTAKLVWLLASAYEWTGEPRYRLALVDKLERSLLPGVLMDIDGDGRVDGQPQLNLADLLAPAARRPGRMWDGHNALPWYQAMNGWALAEAVAAFRVRGDAALEARVRPYALAVLDNLAAEVVSLGGGRAASSGASNIAFALAHGLWTLADPQGLDRPDWERALWSYWNDGLGAAPGDNKTAMVALVLARAEGRVRPALADRAPVSQTLPPLGNRISGLWFDPATSGEGLVLMRVAADRLVGFWNTFDLDGEPMWLLADGPFDGERWLAQAQRSRGPRFGPDYDPGQVQVQPWGELDVRFQDCERARLHWRASVAGFGSGERSLRRLASLAGLGCR